MFSKHMMPLEEIKDQVFVADNAKFKALLREHLLHTMVVRGKTTDDFLMCWTYVVDLLTNLHIKEIPSWYAVDYFLESEEKPYKLRDGADVCFLICSLFPERGNRRCMKTKDYERMGQSMYYSYYNLSGSWVSNYMSVNFIPMAELTKRTMKSLEV